ncbi:MAG: hypothetical protein AAB354_04600 [candidate division KSB1 bacterium]
MNDKKQAIRDEAVTAVGGLVGGALGALAGPEAAALGGAAGSVGALLASKFAPEYFENTVIRRYLNNRKIVTLLKAKIESDLRYSFLDSQSAFDQAMTSARTMLNAANIEEPSIGTLESRLVRGFRWSLSGADVSNEIFTQCISRLADHCRSHGPIRIGCPAICCAPIAIFRDLQERFADSVGLQFMVFCDEINGRTFFESLRTTCNLDFAVGPLEAFVLSDPERKLPLRVIGPLFGEQQRIFVSTIKRTGVRSGVWVFSRSSAKFQYHVGIGVPRSAQELGIDDARQIPDLVESIPPGDMIVTWDPLSSVLDRRKDFAVVHHSEYTVHFMLLGHRSIFSKHRFPVQDFLTVLLTEWRRRQRTQDGLVNILRRDHRYMKAFALGTGHHWTHEV